MNPPSVVLVEPRTNTPYYVNPILLQSIGAAIVEIEEPIFSVEIIDLNTEGGLANLDHLRNADVVIIDTPYGSLNAVEALFREPIRGTAILVGDSVTDGEIDSLLTKLPSRPLSVAGRQATRVAGFVHSLIRKHGIAATDFISLDDGPALPEEATHIPPLLPQEVLDESARRGLTFMLEGLTRGCEEHCTFCHLTINKTTSGLVQAIDYDTSTTMAELGARVRPDIHVQFTDENFFGGRDATSRTSRLDRIETLSTALSHRGFKGSFGVDTRCDTVVDFTEDSTSSARRASTWISAANAGLRYAYLGIESFAETQLRRYGKRFSVENCDAAIDALRLWGIDFTVGLIPLDPLVTVEELTTTIDHIHANDLYPNTASLLKEMRVQARSPYWRSVASLYGGHEKQVANLVWWDPGALPYRDHRIQALAPTIRRIHSSFASAGYRHSDVALFRTLLRGSTAECLQDIPRLVARMEVQVLRLLLDNASSPSARVEQDALVVAKEAVDRIHALTTTVVLEDLRGSALLAARYFRDVFDRISAESTWTATAHPLQVT